MATQPAPKTGALRAVSLTMTALLLGAVFLVPVASATPNVPYTPCPGPSGPYGGWVYVGTVNSVPTHRCAVGPGEWLYCQNLGNGNDNCWTVTTLADHNVVSPAAKVSYPADVREVVGGLTPVDPPALPGYCDGAVSGYTYWQYLYCVLL